MVENATVNIVGEAMLGLVGGEGGALVALLFRVLPSGNGLLLPYSEGGKGSYQTTD